MSPTKQHNGISLRAIQIWLVIGALLLSGLMLYSTYRLSVSYQQLTQTSERHVEMRKAARELMDASDYMTEKVQRFVVNGEYQYVQAYFNEALAMQHREEAIDTMSAESESEEALEKLQQAMDASNALMKREYYAMRLVVEANEYTNLPLALQKVTLSEEDAALSPEEKTRRAEEMVFSNEYYAQKNLIRDNMNNSLNALEKLANSKDASALTSLRDRMLLVRGVIILQTLGVFFLVWLASHLGIHPILDAVERIKHDKTLPEAGTSEFRYLVRAYNRMYKNYKKSLERLNFKASHDELTGVYNRAGYESLLAGIDLNSTCMFLVDVDNFKGINDTYGHETGDRVLVKLVQALQHNFRTEDFICRIGGDEFVVLMQNSSQKQEQLMAAKVEAINNELEQTDDGLPAASISVGIVHGSEAEKVEELFEKTDEAMYQAKQNGKRTYSFYQP